ncbi:MAG: DUF6427 family protein [Prolixibacteraceae bacterium]|jgi:hypothetical protein|nr:DUF6427 family protein [Prolixibacteraceae bacterium]
MFLRLFNSKNVYSAILIPIVAFLFWMEPLRTPISLLEVPGEGMMPLYTFFAKLYTGSSIFPVVSGFVLILLNALILSLLSYEFQFLQQRTFLPGIFYVSIVSSFPSLQTFHPVYPATFFVLLSVYYIFSTYHRKNEISSTFNASFLLSIGALFYLPVITLFPLILISIFVLQKSDNWRLLVIPLIGIALPWLILWTFLFVSGSDQSFISSFFNGIKSVNNQFIFNLGFVIVTIFIFLLSALGSLSLVNSVSIRKMSTRKYFIILYWMLGLSIPSVFLLSSTGLGVIAITTIPVSFLISYFFMAGKRGFWREFLFFLFMATLVAGHLLLFEHV